MKCLKCNKKATIILPTFYSCNSCFIKIIDKRIRKEIRTNNFLKNKQKKETIILIDDNSSDSLFLKLFLKNLNIKYETKKMKISYPKYSHFFKKLSKYSKIILPLCLDDEANYFLESIFNNKNAKYIGHFYYKKTFFFKPLLHVSKKEILFYLKLKKVSFKTKEKKTFLDELEKNYPEIKFSLLKSALEINLNN